MIKNPHVTCHDLVFQHASAGNIDLLPVRCYDDHRPRQHNGTTEPNIPGDREMVQIRDVWR